MKSAPTAWRIAATRRPPPRPRSPIPGKRCEWRCSVRAPKGRWRRKSRSTSSAPPSSCSRATSSTSSKLSTRTSRARSRRCRRPSNTARRQPRPQPARAVKRLASPFGSFCPGQAAFLAARAGDLPSRLEPERARDRAAGRPHRLEYAVLPLPYGPVALVALARVLELPDNGVERRVADDLGDRVAIERSLLLDRLFEHLQGRKHGGAAPEVGVLAGDLLVLLVIGLHRRQPAIDAA